MATETVYGVHPVREVLRAGKRNAHELLYGRSPKDPAVKELLRLARERGVPAREISKAEAERRAPGGNHQGLILVADELPVVGLEAALGSEVITEGSIWIGLDQVTDPHNLGAVIRNAACFGATAVLLTERRSARPTPLVQKIASGATEHVRIVVETNLNQSILRLRKEGFWIYGAEVTGKPLDLMKFHGPAFVLVGAEGRGLRKSTRSHADELVRIPQAPGGVASLNASAAAAVVLYEVRRRLGPP